MRTMSHLRGLFLFEFRMQYTIDTFDGETNKDLGPEKRDHMVNIVAESETVARAHMAADPNITVKLERTTKINGIVMSTKLG